MRLLVDECTGPVVAVWLRERGHDVFSVFEEARGMQDDDVLTKAFAEDRVLITNDKDFGERVFRLKQPHRGVVLLRLEDERAANKVAAVECLLAAHEADLPGRFCVVTEKAIRIVGLVKPLEP
jgi:predicted nuclease of predicted toxin-antitoxin system